MKLRMSLIVCACTAAAAWSAAAAAAMPAPSSALCARWRAGVAQALLSDNPHLAARALADAADAGARLPESERAASAQFLRAAMRIAAARPASYANHIFSPDLADWRAALFDMVERAAWTGGARALMLALIDDMAANPSNYDPAVIRLPGFAAACRAWAVPPDAIDKLAQAWGAAPDAFMNAVWLGAALYPARSEQWRALFAARFSGADAVITASAAFAALDAEHWRDLPAPRQTMQTIIAQKILRDISAAQWAEIDPALFLEIAQSGAGAPGDWERKLAAALAVTLDSAGTPAPALRARLDALIKAHAAPEKSFAAIAPVLAGHPGVFCFLHAPTNGVMDTLNMAPRNRAAARRMLLKFMTAMPETQWQPGFAGLAPYYYIRADTRAARNELFERIVRPTVLARLTPGFTPAQAENAIRKNWTSALISPACFLTPHHHRELVAAFMENLDWEAGITLESGVMMNYRFVAEALPTLAPQWMDDRTPRRDGVRYAADLAAWLDWMLRGGAARPGTLDFRAPDVADALRRICAALRRVRNRFALEQNDLDLRVLSEALASEVESAAAGIRRHGVSSDDEGLARRRRLVRAVRLTLTISALLEDSDPLDGMLELMRVRIFMLPPAGAAPLRVLPPDVLRDDLTLFLALDDELAGCLREMAETPGAGREMHAILRAFVARYHSELQMGLIMTDGFLAGLYQADARLTPFRRYLQTGHGAHPCALHGDAARASFIQLAAMLDTGGFLNAETALVELIGIYRSRLRLSFWKNPLLCGLNANIGMPTLFRLLCNEPPPAATELTAEQIADADWPMPVFLPVIDALLAGFEAGPARVLARNVEYEAGRRGPAVKHTEYYDAQEYFGRLDSLLRAQELLSFPVLAPDETPPETAQSAMAIARALVNAAVTGRRDQAVPPLVLPPGLITRRRLDGERRARLCRLAQKYARTSDDAITAAECAVPLPNAPENAAAPQLIERYDVLRATAFNRLRAALRDDAHAGRLADGLIAMLRLDVCRHGRGRPLANAGLIGDWSAVLPPAGRRRVLIEQWALQNHFPNAVPTLQCANHAAPDLDCPDCRAAVAAALRARVDEFAELRRFCAGQAGIRIAEAPRNRWESIAQLAAFHRRMDNVDEEISAMEADTVKAAWYLISQARRAMETVPAAWRAVPDWTQKLAADESLAENLMALAGFFTGAYAELMPIHGNINAATLLGDGAARQANGDALAVFCLLEADIKSFLLDAAALEQRLPEDAARILFPIGVLAPRALTAVHSAMQPALALGVWNCGTNAVRGGGNLMQFVARGREYTETYFDPRLALEAGGSFSLTPIRLFDEALRSWDLLMAAAEPDDGDAFIYNAWFGDIRRTLAGHGAPPDAQFNLDAFLRAAAGILDDRRYDRRDMAPLRAAATAFQRELEAWLAAGGGAAMGRGFAAMRAPATLVAIAECVADRLGLHCDESDTGALPALEGRQRDVYAAFCRRCLFTGGMGSPEFPPFMRSASVSRFNEISGQDAVEAVKSARARFAALFEPHVSTAGASRRFGGLPGLYRRALAGAPDDPGFWFAGEFAHAYMRLASEIYWHAADTEPGGVAYPWRRDEGRRVCIAAPLPDDPLAADALHTPEIRAQLAWRAACAARHADIPFIFRFFGGVATNASPAAQQFAGADAGFLDAQGAPMGGLEPWDIPAPDTLMDAGLARRLAQIARPYLTRLDARESLMLGMATNLWHDPAPALDALEREQPEICRDAMAVLAILRRHNLEARDWEEYGITNLAVGAGLDVIAALQTAPDGAPSADAAARRHWITAGWLPFAAAMQFKPHAGAMMTALGLDAPAHAADPDWAWLAFLAMLRAAAADQSAQILPAPGMQKLADAMSREWAAADIATAATPEKFWEQTEMLIAGQAVASLFRPELMDRWTLEGGDFVFDSFCAQSVGMVRAVLESAWLAGVLRHDFVLEECSAAELSAAYAARQARFTVLAAEMARAAEAPDAARLHSYYLLLLARFPPCLSPFQAEAVNPGWLRFVAEFGWLPRLGAAPAAMPFLCPLQSDAWRDETGLWQWRPRAAGWRQYLNSAASQGIVE